MASALRAEFRATEHPSDGHHHSRDGTGRNDARISQCRIGRPAPITSQNYCRKRAAVPRDWCQTGSQFSWRKIDSQTWRVELAGATSSTIEYRVFGNTLQNNHAQYNERHAFIGGPSVWMYLVGGKDRPIELSIAVPAGWKVATGMEHTLRPHFQRRLLRLVRRRAAGNLGFRGERILKSLGTTYHVIAHDVVGQRISRNSRATCRNLSRQIVPIFAAVAGAPGQAAPFKDYWFIFHVWPKSRWRPGAPEFHSDRFREGLGRHQPAARVRHSIRSETICDGARVLPRLECEAHSPAAARAHSITRRWFTRHHSGFPKASRATTARLQSSAQDSSLRSNISTASPY